ncbi:hypothetical protein [Wenyingzhuangia sp. IMCC45574]
MRKLFLLTIALLINNLSFSQIKKIEPAKSIEIGTIKTFGAFIIDCHKINDTYLFTYADAKFKHIDEHKSFEFKDIDNAFDTLYETIIDGFNNTPKEPIMIKLPKGVLFLSYIKSYGVVNFRFGHSLDNKGGVIGYSGYLTKKKVKKLFGK